MGTYYGVKAVMEKGEHVTIYNDRPQKPNDTFLVAIVCNGIWSIAPEVTDKREYDEFYNSYCAGNWLSFKVYAVKESDRNTCPDEGRVPCGFRPQT